MVRHSPANPAFKAGTWMQTPHHITRNATISPLAKAVLIVIASHVIPDGYDLSITEIARESGCGRTTVKQEIATLEARQLIRVEHHNRRPNTYWVGPGWWHPDDIAPF